MLSWTLKATDLHPCRDGGRGQVDRCVYANVVKQDCFPSSAPAECASFSNIATKLTATANSYTKRFHGATQQRRFIEQLHVLSHHFRLVSFTRLFWIAIMLWTNCWLVAAS